MNVQVLRLRMNNLGQDVKKVWQQFRANVLKSDDEESHLMTEEEKLDEAIDESFPASDPPGHRSKSLEDSNLH